MVKASDPIPRLENGAIDVATWLNDVEAAIGSDGIAIADALALVGSLKSRSEEFLEKGVELANLVVSRRPQTGAQELQRFGKNLHRSRRK